jgi:hypothetical protein
VCVNEAVVGGELETERSWNVGERPWSCLARQDLHNRVGSGRRRPSDRALLMVRRRVADLWQEFQSGSRFHLQLALENDDSLTRNPHFDGRAG